MDSKDNKTGDSSTEGLQTRAIRVWTEVPKGPKRAIVLGFIVSWALWIPTAKGVVGYGNEGPAIALFPFFFWALVFGGLWVYRGFKK